MDNPRMKNMKPLKELFSFHYKHFLNIYFSLDESYCCQTFCQKFNGFLDEK